MRISYVNKYESNYIDYIIYNERLHVDLTPVPSPKERQARSRIVVKYTETFPSFVGVGVVDAIMQLIIRIYLTRQTLENTIPLHFRNYCGCRDKHPAASRNKAIAMSTASYILMVDGDMLLHKHFVRDHLRAATAGKFVQGRRVLTSAELSNQILSCKKKCVSPFSKGIKNRLNACCCRALSPLVSALFSKQKYTSVRGCNMAFWREDVIAVNGFNEAFVGWGREDSEFVVRLFNNGIKRQDLRLGGVAYHLYHQENSRKMLNVNEQLLANTVEQHLKRCDCGINQYGQKNDKE